MAIKLDLQPFRQRTPNSCWWASMRMVLCYYGLPHPVRPELFRHDFLPPESRPTAFAWARPRWPGARYEQLDRGAWTPVIPRSGVVDTSIMLAPWAWYELGLTGTEEAMGRLCDITGFRALPERPAWNAWTLDTAEHLVRSHGPFIITGNWGGFGMHAIVCIGRSTDITGQDMIRFMDPAGGDEVGMPVDIFQARMTTATLGRFNPFYLPQTPPLRALVTLDHGRGRAGAASP